jgi:hypothetical protein
MRLPYRIFIFTVLQSFANTLVQRAAYFFTRGALHYQARANLTLALVVGLAYVAGALLSHRVARRLGEKPTLLLALACQVACLLTIALLPRSGPVIGGVVAYSFFSALMWPLVESFVSAGRAPLEASRIIGFYNVCWSTASPAAVWISGTLIAWLGSGLFAVSAGATVLGALFILHLPHHPAHHDLDHADRPPAQRLAVYRRLLGSSRWSLVLSYALLFVLSPLMPTLFMDQLHFGIVAATLLAGCIDAARAATFLVMAQIHGWHGRRGILLLTAGLLPLGFLVALLGPMIIPGVGSGAAVIVAGELAFGVGMGMAYYTALYYAMVVGNASVDAGGWHEGLIGSGFSLGPAAALLGACAAGAAAGPSAGLLWGIVPLLALFGAGSLIPLRRGSAGPVRL